MEYGSIVDTLADMLVADFQEHYLVKNPYCDHCAKMSDDEIADLAARKTRETLKMILSVQKAGM